MSCSAACFALHLLGELVAQLLEVDLAQVDREPLGVVVAGRLRADGLVDDPVQLLEHLGHVGRVAPLLQLLVDGLDVVVPLGVGEGARLHQQRLEADEDLPRHDLEAALGLVGRVERVHGVAQGLDAGEPRRAEQPGRVEAQARAGGSPPPRWPGAAPPPVPRSGRRCRRPRRLRPRRPGRTAPAPRAGS